MLASLALQLLALSGSPALPPAGAAVPGSLLAQAQGPEEPPQNPPLPRKPGTGPEPAAPPAPPPSGGTPAPAGQAAAPAPAAATGAPAAAEPAPHPAPRQLSLLSGEALGGGSALLAEGGWSSIGLRWAQGVTAKDDLGLLADFDWAFTELRLGGLYRRALGRTGSFDVALRLTLSWYADLGSTWAHSGNLEDRGIELGPALQLSRHTAGGTLSMAFALPLVVTTRRGGGLLFSPNAAVAYEVPLYGDFTLGVQTGLGWRGGSGGAPLPGGRGELQLLLVGGYKIY
ncbi:MAG TPA: hypothetical protein VML50_08375 [Anaeromyxobacter sp.]|nr:hypothetical protein [Anaeromyxobacter sp.]